MIKRGGKDGEETLPTTTPPPPPPSSHFGEVVIEVQEDCWDIIVVFDM
jgi:hypothetical protein